MKAALFYTVVACSIAVACATFPATREAGVRRAAEAYLKSCRKGLAAPDQYKQCYTEVQAYCRTQGLEKTCGEGYQP